MWDESAYVTADELLERSNKNKLLQACQEYFEISIGVRRPTKSERNQATEWLLKSSFGDEEMTPAKQVMTMKYPISTTNRDLILKMYQIEYAIFQIIERNSSFVDGPYIPMFRYELSKQKSLSETSDYDTAVIRQSAFLETFFKMKMGVWMDDDGNFLNWNLCVECAYRGEGLITDSMKCRLKKLASVRNKYAHDWRQYVLRKPSDEMVIKESFISGLGVIAELYSIELEQTYSNYTSNRPYGRLPTKWSDREKLSVKTSTAQVEFTISCDNCGTEFSPQHEGWKRCPKCDTRHNFYTSIDK